MPGKREQEIIDAYEEWSPNEETVSDLVERLGVSRQRLYDVLNRNQVMPKSRRQSETLSVDQSIITEMSEMALGYLLRQLQEARAELGEYRERYGPLNGS